MCWIRLSARLIVPGIVLCLSALRADAQAPDTGLFQRVDDFLKSFTVPAGFYELHVVKVSAPHGHTLELAEQYRKEPFYLALRRLGEKHLREGETEEQDYRIWYDGRRFAARSVTNALHVNDARYEKSLSWKGLNDEYYWLAGAGPLRIQATDAIPAAHQCYMEKRYFWKLLSAGFRRTGEAPDPLFTKLSSVEPLLDDDGRTVQVHATFVQPDNPDNWQRCTIACDPPGIPNRIVSTTYRWESDENESRAEATDWRAIGSGILLPFHLQSRSLTKPAVGSLTIELISYRPLVMADADAFYPPPPDTPNEFTGKALFTEIEDLRQKPAVRVSVRDRGDVVAAGVELPPGGGKRSWAFAGAAGVVLAAAAAGVLLLSRRYIRRERQ